MVLTPTSFYRIINRSDKLAAFSRLEASRKSFFESIEYDAEREDAMNAKYGRID